MPEIIKQAIKGQRLFLTYGKHAKQEASLEKYSQINLPNHLVIADAVEVTVEARRITKLLIRIKYNNDFDLSLVIIPDFALNTGFVKTVWLNEVSDVHKTLKREGYATKF